MKLWTQQTSTQFEYKASNKATGCIDKLSATLPARATSYAHLIRNKNCKDWKNRELISIIYEPTRIRTKSSLTSNVLVCCIRTKPNRVCLDLSSCITSITITCNSPKTKQQITKSGKLTFILRPCDRHPGEGVFYSAYVEMWQTLSEYNTTQ